MRTIGNLTVSGSLSTSGSITATTFIGDGSGLVGVTSYTDADTLSYINSINVISGSITWSNLEGKPANIVSSSAQLSTEISGAFTSVSASIASDIANISTDFADITNKPTLVSSSLQIDYNSIQNQPTIPTNNNQLTNGAGYTTCTGDITGVTAGTGLSGGGTSGAVTLSVGSIPFSCITGGANSICLLGRTSISNPGTNDAVIWYDCVEKRLKTTLYGYGMGTWSTGGALNVARSYLAGAGTQNAGLGFGGYTNGNVSCTEEYNGTSWSTGGVMGVARSYLAGAGTQNEGLAFGGGSATEEYNGSSWSTGGSLNVARSYLAGAGTQNAGLAFGGTPTTNATEEYNRPLGYVTCTIT